MVSHAFATWVRMQFVGNYCPPISASSTGSLLPVFNGSTPIGSGRGSGRSSRYWEDWDCEGSFQGSCQTVCRDRLQGERGVEGSREIRGEKYIRVHAGYKGLLEEFREGRGHGTRKIYIYLCKISGVKEGGRRLLKGGVFSGAYGILCAHRVFQHLYLTTFDASHFLHYPFLWHTLESCVVKFSCFIISCNNIFVVWSYPWNFLAVNWHYDSFVPRFSDQEWDYTRQENTQSTELLKELTAFMATMQLLVKCSRAEESWETYTGTVTVKTDGHWESCHAFATNLIRSTVFSSLHHSMMYSKSLHLMTYIFIVHSSLQ